MCFFAGYRVMGPINLDSCRSAWIRPVKLFSQQSFLVLILVHSSSIVRGAVHISNFSSLLYTTFKQHSHYLRVARPIYWRVLFWKIVYGVEERKDKTLRRHDNPGVLRISGH